MDVYKSCTSFQNCYLSPKTIIIGCFVSKIIILCVELRKKVNRISKFFVNHRLYRLSRCFFNPQKAEERQSRGFESIKVSGVSNKRRFRASCRWISSCWLLEDTGLHVPKLCGKKIPHNFGTCRDDFHYCQSKPFASIAGVKCRYLNYPQAGYIDILIFLKHYIIVIKARVNPSSISDLLPPDLLLVSCLYLWQRRLVYARPLCI